MLGSPGQYVGRLLTYDSKDERTPSYDRNLRRRDLTAREALILEAMQGTLLMNSTARWRYVLSGCPEGFDPKFFVSGGPKL